MKGEGGGVTFFRCFSAFVNFLSVTSAREFQEFYRQTIEQGKEAKKQENDYNVEGHKFRIDSKNCLDVFGTGNIHVSRNGIRNRTNTMSCVVVSRAEGNSRVGTVELSVVKLINEQSLETVPISELKPKKIKPKIGEIDKI